MAENSFFSISLSVPTCIFRAVDSFFCRVKISAYSEGESFRSSLICSSSDFNRFLASFDGVKLFSVLVSVESIAVSISGVSDCDPFINSW